MFKNEDDLKRIISRLKIDTEPNPVHKDNLRRQMLSEFNKTRQRPLLDTDLWQITRGIIMNRRIIKLATAAVIIIAVLAGLQHFTGSFDGSGVAWAHVVQRVEQIRTCVFNSHITMTGSPRGEITSEADMYVSSEYGFRADTYMNGKHAMTQYSLPAEKVMISVMPEQKKYMRMLLTDELVNKMRQQGYSDPRDIVRQFMEGQYTELGRDIIDGVEVEGIETTDQKIFGGQFDSCVGRLWVDVETHLPVRMEMEMEGFMADKSIQMVMDGYQWDVELDASVFEPNIPDDYILLAEVKMPSQDEGSAVKGLRLFAEIADGNYPTTMGIMKIMAESEKVMKNSFDIKAMKADPNSESSQEMMQKFMEKTMTIHGAAMFYAELVKQGKEPAYYGDTVTAEDTDAVLMRWKISDDEYRVIFGDLTTENVTAEQLAELESQLP